MSLMTFGVSEWGSGQAGQGLDIRWHLGVQVLSEKYDPACSEEAKGKQGGDAHHPQRWPFRGLKTATVITDERTVDGYQTRSSQAPSRWAEIWHRDNFSVRVVQHAGPANDWQLVLKWTARWTGRVCSAPRELNRNKFGNAAQIHTVSVLLVKLLDDLSEPSLSDVTPNYTFVCRGGCCWMRSVRGQL